MTKDELSKYIKIVAEIKQIRQELETVVPVYVMDSVKASSTVFPYTEYNRKIEGFDTGSCERKVNRIQNRLNRKLTELVEEKDKITEYIYNLDDSDLRQILVYRYIDGMLWEEIGQNMNYAPNTVRKKHNKYLESMPPNATFNVVKL